MQKQKGSFWLNYSQKFLKTKIKSFILIPIIILAFFGMLFLMPTIAYPAQVEAIDLVRLTNDIRQQYGLKPLAENNDLALAAKNKANDLLESNYFSHSRQNRGFSDWVKETGYEYAYTGENLAMDFMTNEGVISGWMNSGRHRLNLLNKKYKEIGIAAVAGWFNNHRTVMVVQIFGTKLEELKNANNKYLAINNGFLLPRFLDLNTYDIFIPKAAAKTIARHDNIEKLSVINSGHLKEYHNYNSAYWGEIDRSEFQDKNISIKLLGKNEKSLIINPK